MSREFNPNYVTRPGRTLQETLGLVGMSPTEPAARANVDAQTVAAVLAGSAAITHEFPDQIEAIFEVPTLYRMNLENIGTPGRTPRSNQLAPVSGPGSRG